MSHLWATVKRTLTFIYNHAMLLIGISTIGVVIALLIWTVENYAPEEVVLNGEALIQFVGGNWPNEANDHKAFAFAVGPTFRLMLVVGAIRGTWVGLITLRDIVRLQTMKVTEILKDLDRSIETRVLQVLEGHLQQQYRQEIHDAIVQGQEDFWSQYLPTIMGDEVAAKRIRDKFFAAEL